MARISHCFLFQRRPASGLSRGRCGVFWLWNWGLLLAAAIGLGLISLVLATGTYGWPVFWDYLSSPVLLALNLLPPALLSTLLYSLLGRAWLAQLLTAIPVLALSVGNYYKLTFRNDPVIASDLLVLGEAGTMTQRYRLFLTRSIAAALALAVLSVVVLAVFVRGRPRFKGRLAGVLVGLAVSGALVPVYASDELYTDSARLDHLNEWVSTQQYLSHGLIYPFLHSIKQALPHPPDGYSRQETQALLGQYKDADIPDGEKVNLVGIMLEAFADFSGYDQIQFQQDVYADFHQLESESYSGNLITNIFAGGTINTERAFLTGLSSGDFNFRTDASSYVWYFRDQGYHTSGDHPSNQWFYNRSNINSYLGFEQYRFVENYYSQFTDGSTADDSVFFPALTDSILEQLRADQPLFSFSVSYQGHGPYSSEQCLWGETDDYIANYDLDEASRTILANYLGSVQNTSGYLLQLAQQLEACEEPGLLVVFGDHKPWLGNNSTVYSALGIDLFDSDRDSLYNCWSTRYLIWANDAAKEVLGNDFVGTGPDISPCFLMNLLFEQCGWEGDAYMQAVHDCWQALPVIQTSGFYVTDEGELTWSLSEADQALAQRFSFLEYYRSTHFSG